MYRDTRKLKDALRVSPAVTRSPPYYSRVQVDSRGLPTDPVHPPPKTSPAEAFFGIIFLLPCLTPTSVRKGAFWTPFGDPNRARVNSRCVLRHHFLENVNVHEIVRFPIQNAQNRPQDVAKVDPRSAQEGFKIVTQRNLFSIYFLDPFLAVLGCVLAPSWGP